MRFWRDFFRIYLPVLEIRASRHHVHSHSSGSGRMLIRHQQTRTPRFAGCLVFRFTMCAESALKDPAREILSYVAQP